MNSTVWFDFETDGRDPNTCQPIQIAAIAAEYVDGRELARFERKLQFDLERADPAALAMNSYDAEVWEREAVPRGEALDAFLDFLMTHSTLSLRSKRGHWYNVAALAGHNVTTFDVPILRRVMREETGRSFLPACYWKPFDTLQLATWVLGPQAEASMQALCDRYGIEPGRHDALGDVLANVQVSRALRQSAAHLAA